MSTIPMQQPTSTRRAMSLPRFAALLLCIATLPSIAVADDSNGQSSWKREQQAIAKIIREQNQSWNDGSIDGFMKHYWKSEKLTFSAGGKTTRGWTATRDRYKSKYQTKEQMGQLKFSQLEFERLGKASALVIGRWQLTKKTELVGGNFSIVLRKLDGHWLIVHDHSSSDDSIGGPKED